MDRLRRIVSRRMGVSLDSGLVVRYVHEMGVLIGKSAWIKCVMYKKMHFRGGNRDKIFKS